MEYIKHSFTRFQLNVGMCTILFMLLVIWNGIGQDRNAYIETFSSIAISEMHRSGIPASIKLAQGILESNAGGSTLAQKANNHFGIKCGSSWRGKRMFRKDDDLDRKGRLVKSCFRSFSSAEESYIAHSDFLSDPKKEYRYGRLFELASDDYRGWAFGLKKAGYATNPRYPQLLIRIIEDYKLYNFDFSENLIAHNNDDVVDETHVIETQHVPIAPGTSSRTKKLILKYENQVKFVIARKEDTPRKISDELSMPSHRILQCNEKISRKNQPLNKGERIYLQPKKSKFKGRRSYHVVQADETMIDISDRYAVKLAKLYKMNRMQSGQNPQQGQRIYLRGKNPSKVKTTQCTDQENTYLTYLWGDESDKAESEASTNNTIEVQTAKLVTTEPDMPEFVEYVVQPKDTLYAIARRHGTTVAFLKNLNNLDTATIHPGQVLKVQ